MLEQGRIMKKPILVIASTAIAILVIAISSSTDTNAQEKPKTCETEYSRHLRSTPSYYDYNSQSDAFRALQRELDNEVSLREESRSSASGGPCSSTGWQVKVRATWKKSGEDAGYPASLMGCPICEDTSSGPRLVEKWRFSYDD
jgi:hypothetical protein